MSSSFRKVLVTGAAGFIASTTAGLLLDGGTQVLGVDNLGDSCDVRLKKYRLRGLAASRRFRFRRADVCAPSLKTVFKAFRPEAVLHLAARAGVRYSLENPRVYADTNVLGTLNVLELCRQYGVRKMVLASTSSLYAAEKAPFREDSPANRPISPYAATKKSAEALCYTYHYLYGIDMTVLRYFTVYGPAGRPDMSYFKFIQKVLRGETIEIYGDGRQMRDFTYVDDIAEGTRAALGLKGFQTVNLGGGECHELMRLVRLIEKHSGKKAKPRFLSANKTDMRDTLADNSLARKLLGWKPRVDLEEGVRRTVEWHLRNQSWVSGVKLG